ncbi:hypothetical protein ACP6C3_30480 [Mycolicibacterium septicum]|uniref:Uncharacterized protein n=1 Tax=Mycolicibacterium septicum TaxID=98668 RepID=A0ABW9M512_9MYCO
MRNGEDWLGIGTDSDPQLIVGWRPRARQLTGGRIDLHADTFEDLRAVVHDAMAYLASAEAIDFGHEVLPVAGEEYIRREIVDLPAVHRAEPEEGGDDQDDSADLVRLIADCEGLTDITAGQLADGNFALYGIVFRQPSGEMIGCVRAINPARTLKKAAFWGRFAGSLRRTQKPDLMLESEVDLVVTGSELAIIRRSAYDRLFSDLDELAAEVPANVAGFDVAMPELPFAEGTAEAIVELGTALSSVAKRLNRLPSQPGISAMTPSSLREVLAKHGEDPAEWFDHEDKLVLDRRRAKEFLDIAEGRWWTADFQQERRRADKFRAR